MPFQSRAARRLTIGQEIFDPKLAPKPKPKVVALHLAPMTRTAPPIVRARAPITRAAAPQVLVPTLPTADNPSGGVVAEDMPAGIPWWVWLLLLLGPLGYFVARQEEHVRTPNPRRRRRR